MKKRILSIDGGGMRGIVSAVLLQKLEEIICEYSQNPKARIADYFELVAGTSTGSILTVFYLFPNEKGESKFSAKEVTQAYIDYGRYVFRRQFGFPFWGAKYTNRCFEEMLNELFGDTTLGMLRRPCLLTSYDITGRKAVFFNSVTGRADEQRNYPLKDAIMASCAAPTYFPPICKRERANYYGCLIDGGVVANNPSMCALIEAMKLPDCCGLQDELLLSIGNVKNTKEYTYRRVKYWSLFQWAVPIFDIMMDGSEQTVDYQLRKLYKSNGNPQDYIRIQLRTEEYIPKMDHCSPEDIKRFLDFGARLVKKEQHQLEHIARRLLADK